MAGDWIKMRVDLAGSPEVKGLARRTGLTRFDVVGRLHAVWSWADQHLRNCNAAGVTPADIDDEAEHVGFAQAMADEGWLKILSTGIAFPKFDRHNGKPAKERALTNKRVKRHRTATTVTPPLPEVEVEVEVISSVVTVTTEAPQPPAAAQEEPQPPLPPQAPDTSRIATVVRLCKAVKVESAPDNDPFIAKWINGLGASNAQIEKALAESRAPYRKPFPASLPLSYVDKVLGDIVAEDARAREAAARRATETQRVLEEQRTSAGLAVPMPDDFPKLGRRAAP